VCGDHAIDAGVIEIGQQGGGSGSGVTRAGAQGGDIREAAGSAVCLEGVTRHPETAAKNEAAEVIDNGLVVFVSGKSLGGDKEGGLGGGAEAGNIRTAGGIAVIEQGGRRRGRVRGARLADLDGEGIGDNVFLEGVNSGVAHLILIAERILGRVLVTEGPVDVADGIERLDFDPIVLALVHDHVVVGIVKHVSEEALEIDPVEVPCYEPGAGRAAAIGIEGHDARVPEELAE
jgi:hypothetical protein